MFYYSASMNRIFKAVLRLPGLYHLVAFITAKRIIVRGESMLPTLLPGERVLFDNLAYRVGDPRVGDVVVATHADRPGRTMIKRVAAVPGDDVDGQSVGEGEYWLLGDTPEFSTDSRQLGAFRRENIVGRGWWVVWPASELRRVS